MLVHSSIYNTLQNVTFTGSRRALAPDECAPAALLIFAFLCTPAPAEAAEPALVNPAAAAFRFCSKIIFVRLSKSIFGGGGVGCWSVFLAGALSPPGPGLPFLSTAAEPTAPSPPFAERGALDRSGTGLGHRLFGGGSALPSMPGAFAAGDAGSCLRYRRKILSRYSSSAVRTSAAATSATCVALSARTVAAYHE